MTTGIVLIGPIIGAFIGWLTNKVALLMLFRPYHPRGFGLLTWQGLIARRKSDLARAISKTVTERLLTHEDLNTMIQKVEIRNYLREITDSMIDRRLSGRVRGYQLIPEAVRFRLVSVVKEIIAERLPEKMDDLSPGLASRFVADLDIARHLEEKISGWPEEEVERVVRAVAQREMKEIEIAGAVLGFLIGLIQALTYWIW